MATRGVLLGHAANGPQPTGFAVTARDLDAAELREGVTIEAGDALVVRFGWTAPPDPRNPSPVSSAHSQCS
ncbi:cyclase family protein [Streptomyces sp. NPDC059564]|uniref:cyclase family protein n=1 Tax=Streptomyces sp. NPDC059564 TaxID=3346865 RepID=UPI00367D04FC